MLPKLEREIAQNNVFPLLLFNLSTEAFWVRYAACKNISHPQMELASKILNPPLKIVTNGKMPLILLLGTKSYLGKFPLLKWQLN